MASKPSLKHLQIDQAAKSMVLVTGISVFVIIFCLFSGKTLVSQMSYQNRAESAKQKALTQLKGDVTASQQLVTSYKNFVNTPQNIIGGSSTSSAGGSDGDNAKIILDALPSQYDFPALATSLQYLLNSQGVNIDAISGTDLGSTSDGGSSTSATTTTSTAATSSAAVGSAVAMPFSISVDGPYQSVENLVTAFQNSIRPFQFLTVSISGNEADLMATITAQTYYQPETTFQITTKAVE